MSHITLVLTGKDFEENQSYLDSYRGQIDLAELRLDCLDTVKEGKAQDRDVLEAFVKNSPVPLILTVRRSCDGGFYEGDEAKRLKLYSDFIPLGFGYVDLEDDLEPSLVEEAEKTAREAGVRIIRSFHDFKGFPDNLAQRMKSNIKEDDIPKAAVTLNHSREIVPFLEAAAELKGQDKIILAMGERGYFSRILAERLGSFLSFTSPAQGVMGAPGHMDPTLLIERYRFRDLKADWPLYGVIGNPIIQSRSPELHNNWLKQAGLPGVYIPFLLDDIEDLIPMDNILDFGGLSVTLPFKEKLITVLDEPSLAVKKIGASNTYYKKNGRRLGENTDAPGFLYPLLDSMGIDRRASRPLEGKKCTVIGAGGASRAILFALTNAGAEVLILNRTAEKAEKLAAEFSVQSGTLSSESIPLMEEFSDIIVQTTNAGMPPQEEQDPIDFYEFKGREFVYDIVYKPAVTVMMDRAAKAGCTVLGGWEMLREQGMVQFELFTGEAVPKGKA
ncbi:MAG: type I 3-dehydroquinate dehydratase [Spirochaetales bacterium]|nr:type I 3-dehydroquinate dehydratase [Spirochaetales bacterium]